MSDLMLGTSARPDRDGCDCPEAVEYCRHFEGWTLVISAARSLPKEARTKHPYISGFTVNQERHAPDEWCNCGCGWRGWPYDDDTIIHYHGDSEADALAVFHEAEMRLLRGAVDD